MKKEILELQKLMREEGMDIYYIPSSDFHSSEYMHPYFRCREYLSGFDGSAGDMVVTASDALLWTHGTGPVPPGPDPVLQECSNFHLCR